MPREKANYVIDRFQPTAPYLFELAVGTVCTMTSALGKTSIRGVGKVSSKVSQL
jgi:hypothetical protein